MKSTFIALVVLFSALNSILISYLNLFFTLNLSFTIEMHTHTHTKKKPCTFTVHKIRLFSFRKKNKELILWIEINKNLLEARKMSFVTKKMPYKKLLREASDVIAVTENRKIYSTKIFFSCIFILLTFYIYTVIYTILLLLNLYFWI